MIYYEKSIPYYFRCFCIIFSDDLDKLFFEFANSENVDIQEKQVATVSYFHLKKFIQCIIEKRSAKDVSYFMVKDFYC